MRIGALLVTLVVCTLFLVPFGMFLYSVWSAEHLSRVRMHELQEISVQDLSRRIHRTDPFESLAAAAKAAGWSIGWDDHWPTWGFGINAPGDPGHLLWEFKAVPERFFLYASPASREKWKQYGGETDNQLVGRVAAPNVEERAALKKVLSAFSLASGIEVIE